MPVCKSAASSLLPYLCKVCANPLTDAEIVFGSHGSGLANCIALSPKSTLIEVCPEQFYTKQFGKSGKAQFHILTLAVGCQYQY